MPGVLELLLEDATRAISDTASERLSRELPLRPLDETAGGMAGRVAVASSAVRPRGDVLLARWDSIIHSLGVRWHKDQLRFLRGVRNNAIPGFYGSEWPMHRERVCRMQRIDGITRPQQFTTPRRWGKTWSMAGAAACYALTVPRSTQLIFSTGRRASELALKHIYGMLCAHPEGRATITTYNQERLVLTFAEDDVRTIYAFPSNVRVRARRRRTHAHTGGGTPRGTRPRRALACI